MLNFFQYQYICFKLVIFLYKSRHKKRTYNHIYMSTMPCQFKYNAQNRNRTSDTRIFSPLLYQLSMQTSQSPINTGHFMYIRRIKSHFIRRTYLLWILYYHRKNYTSIPYLAILQLLSD